MIDARKFPHTAEALTRIANWIRPKVYGKCINCKYMKFPKSGFDYWCECCPSNVRLRKRDLTSHGCWEFTPKGEKE